jgi:hypothetical protein
MVLAVQPTVAAARALAPVGETGGLRRSIGFAVRVYRRGGRSVYGIVGPRRGFGVNGTEPANYAHLVEYGHAIAVGGRLTRGRRIQLGVLAGTVAARPFLRPAWDATKGQVLKTLETVLRQRVDAAVVKNQKTAARKEARQAAADRRALAEYAQLAAA